MRPPRDIRAHAVVPAPPEDVFEFLADLEHHWLLADRFIEVLSLDCGPDGRCVGGRVRMRGPFGVRRTASTQVLAADPSHQMFGVAEIGRSTRAFVRWKLRASDGASRVSLEATVDRAGPVDALLLALGGRVWLSRRFAALVERLAVHFSADGTAAERNPRRFAGAAHDAVIPPRRRHRP